MTLTLIDASTRDWTDSINVSVNGVVNTQATNNSRTDNRLVNIRAKDSDLNIQNITADGNIILTASDWKQADTRPTPNDEEYFKGYSVLSAAINNATLYGQNISIIASNAVGAENNKLVYMQDTASNPQSSVSFEVENDLYISGRANSANETQIYQIISKRGTIDLDLASDAVIKEITAGRGLRITQKAQNLTIMNLGMPISADGASAPFEDMLYLHDDIEYVADPATPEKSIVPNYVVIRALDAIDHPERGDSKLKIYSLSVRGNQGENIQYNPDGSRMADVTLVADNIYANSAKAPDSTIPTQANPNGYKQTEKTYSDEQFGGDDTINYAQGINSFADGGALTVDIRGVSADIVAEFIDNPQRNTNEYDFKTKNAVISVNDYVDTERGVKFNSLYADNAYINTMDTNLAIRDSYITNYAEIRNGNRSFDNSKYLTVVDNDFRRLVPSTAQLYTQKTGHFGLGMNNKIKLYTTAPVVHYDWDKLVNTYSDENSFVRLGLKETELRQRTKEYYVNNNAYIMPQNIDPSYEVLNNSGIFSDLKILEISRTKATIINRHNWQVGEEHEILLAFDDIDIKAKCIVITVEEGRATVEFLDLPAGVANKLTYHYMKTAAN